MLQNVVEGGITVDEDQTWYQIDMCEVSPQCTGREYYQEKPGCYPHPGVWRTEFPEWGYGEG